MKGFFNVRRSLIFKSVLLYQLNKRFHLFFIKNQRFWEKGCRFVFGKKSGLLISVF